VPADYDAIRDENIRRYGYDDTVLNLLGQLYSERTHFIFELLQNAEDAHARELVFELSEDRLEVRHDGRRFDKDDVVGICGIGRSTKREDLTRIGKFGIGFKSVYAYTRTPQIHNREEHFRIERYVRPYGIEPVPGRPAEETLFIFPFDQDEPSAGQAAAEISAALSRLDLTALLFLRHIERVRILGASLEPTVLERVGEEPAGGGRDIVLERRCGDGTTMAQWRAWQRPLDAHGQPGLKTEIAFQVTDDDDGTRRVVRTEAAPLVVFFPTEKETFLGFLLQGPFRTTPARDNVPKQDPWNQILVREAGPLLCDALEDLRREGLLTADALATLPLDPARFEPDSMFRPIFDAARAALKSRPLIPVAGDQGHASAADLKLARGTGLRELLSPGQLTQLYAAPGSRSAAVMQFAHETITQDRTAGLWRYLREELGVDEVTPLNLATRLTRKFLEAQSDEWIVSFYEFLQQNPALWRAARYKGEQPGPARLKPILRLEDGSHVAPGTDQHHPAAYLPGTIETGFATVRRAVAGHEEARKFLKNLGLTTPDSVAEVLDNVLPQYRAAEYQQLDRELHAAHLGSIELALAEAPADRREQLRRELKATSFLIANNLATGECRLMMPTQIYRRTDELELYFEGNPQAWFLDASYEQWPGVIGSLDIRSRVTVRAQRPDIYGHVIIHEQRGWHERGLHGFDYEAKIDGLEFALDNPNLARCEYIWNALLVPSHHLVSGETEEAGRQDYSNATRTTKQSEIGKLATTKRWLPGPDGAFARPRDLMMGNLPETYRRDEVLARALGMMQPLVEEASRELNVPARVLRALSEHPDLIEMIEKQLAGLSAQGDDQPEPTGEAGSAQPADYGAELAAAFDRPAQLPGPADEEPSVHPSSGQVSNPEFRSGRIRDEIEEAVRRDRPAEERFRLVPRRVWDIKDAAVKHYLFQQYQGRCQICGDTFARRDGSPYFEGLYLVSRVKGQWLDRPGNVIALCATCCAKFQHGSVTAEDIRDQVLRWRAVAEGGGPSACLHLQLCGEPVELRFTERHLLDLREICRAGQQPEGAG
jgi:hypothetical protein